MEARLHSQHQAQRLRAVLRYPHCYLVLQVVSKCIAACSLALKALAACIGHDVITLLPRTIPHEVSPVPTA